MGKGMSKILPGLYVGCYADYTDVEELTKHNITHVVSACVMDSDTPPPANVSRIVVNVDDRPSESISPHFMRCIEFIHKARASGGNVLVHCMAGVSRSVTITAAYLLTISDINWRQALSCIRAARSVANPNYGFQVQIQEWCETERPACQEILRRWPPAPYSDKETLNQLLEKHENWVLTGEHDEDERLYPLAPGAYKCTSASDGADAGSAAKKESKGDRRRKVMREFLRATIGKERLYDAKTKELERKKKASESDTKDSDISSRMNSQCSLGASNSAHHESLKTTDQKPILTGQQGEQTQTKPETTNRHVSGYQYVQSAEHLRVPFDPPVS